MTYEFIQTKDPEYLAFLAENIEKELDPKSKAATLLSIFRAQINEAASKGRKY